jgi:hypothetical protein
MNRAFIAERKYNAIQERIDFIERMFRGRTVKTGDLIKLLNDQSF